MAKQNDLNRYYRILGLNPGASLSEVKQAYRKLVKTEHPDLFNHNPLRRREAEEKFRQISEAYVYLRNYYQPNSTDTPFNSNRTGASSSQTTRTANTSRTSTQTHNTSTTSNNRNSRSNDRRILPVVATASFAGALALIGVTIAVNNYTSQQNSSSQNSPVPQQNPTPEDTPETATPQLSPVPQTQPSPQIAALTVPPQQCRTIAPTIGNSARIFARPSRNADSGKRIPQDTKVAFIGGRREFVEIQLPDKSKGWIFNDQLYPCAIAADSKPEIAQITAPQKQCLTIAPTAGRGARIFRQPSRNADLGKRIPKNTQVTLLGERREFIEIKLSDGYRGWIFNDQAQPCALPSDSPVIASNTERSPQCRIVAPTIGDSARIFARPSRNADSGKKIPQDTKVAFIGGMGEFVEIQLPDNSKGWVFNDQLYPCAIASDSQPEIASIEPSQKQCLTIAPTAGGGARIFSRPSRNAAVGKRIPKDTQVTLLRERQEFVEIQLSDGDRGWIFNDQAQPCQSEIRSQKSQVRSHFQLSLGNCYACSDKV